MNWFLVLTLGATGVAIVGACVVTLFARHRFRRRHRVDPRVTTGAPARWIADPRAPARLHRRLARVGRTSQTVADEHRVAKRRLRRAPDQPAIVSAAEDLRRQAIDVDERLVRVSMLARPARHEPLQQLHAEVTQLEEAGVRLVSLSAQLKAPTTSLAQGSPIEEATAHIHHLADAHRELDEIDRNVGVGHPAPTADPAPSEPVRWSPISTSRPTASEPPPVAAQPTAVVPPQPQPQPQTWPPQPETRPATPRARRS